MNNYIDSKLVQLYKKKLWYLLTIFRQNTLDKSPITDIEYIYKGIA